MDVESSPDRWAALYRGPSGHARAKLAYHKERPFLAFLMNRL